MSPRRKATTLACRARFASTQTVWNCDETSTLPTTCSSVCSTWSAIGPAMIAAGPGRTCSNLPWMSRALTALVATLLLTASMTAGSLETEATIAA